jgi:hypothetical protein
MVGAYSPIERERVPTQGCDDVRMTSDVPGGRAPSAVFLSVTERHKGTLARPFRDLLRPTGQGFIVSDLPLIDDAYSPEDNVDAYLERSQAVVVFATVDQDAGQFTRPNIADEMARARMKPHLRNRICVLKQAGVTLASNTNPVYRSLDPDHPGPAFAAALEQLKAWGFDVNVAAVPDEHPDAAPSAYEPPRMAISSNLAAELAKEGLDRALAVVPQARNNVGEAALVLVATAAPRTALLRPSELEDPALATWLEREALYGDRPVLERGEGTATGISGDSLIARQSRAWVAIDEEGTVVLWRPVVRKVDRGIYFRGIIEEEVLADLEADLAFVDRVLARIDSSQRASHIVPVAALLGASSTAWRTRAEQAASPNSMTMNISGGDRIVVQLRERAQARGSLNQQGLALARDLMVLLRRAATRR